MAIAAEQDGWRLVEAEGSDLGQLMTWFVDALSTNVWGGPRFRYPFTAESFREDCYWGRMARKCYKAMVFEIRDYPEGASMADECYYLTRPVLNTSTDRGRS